MARSSDDPRLCFKALYHDELSGLTKEFQVRFFFSDKSVELTDLNTRKVFLKRTDCPNLETSDFVLGKTVVVFGRLLHLTEYMDVVTHQLCEGVSKQSGASPLSPSGGAGGGGFSSASLNSMANAGASSGTPQCGTCYVFVERSKFFSTLGKVLSVLDVELGFTITGLTAGTIPTAAVTSALKDIGDLGAPNGIVTGEGNAVDNLVSLRGRMVCCFRLAKAGCNATVAEIYRRLAPSQYNGQEGPMPSTSRAGMYAVATSTTHSPLETLFEAIAARAANKYVSGAAAVGSVVIIKPHLMLRKAAGDVMQVLLEQSGGELTGLSLINLSSRDATNVLAAYRGVLPDFQGTTNQLSSGAAIAVHLCSRKTAAILAAEDAYRDQCADEVGNHASNSNSANSNSSTAYNSNDGDDGGDYDVFLATRALCGPFDPTIAKAIRSSTIRARYGVDRSLNAVHCCDIEEDVASVCRFVFAYVAMRKLSKPSSECS